MYIITTLDDIPVLIDGAILVIYDLVWAKKTLKHIMYTTQKVHHIKIVDESEYDMYTKKYTPKALHADW